MTGTRRRKRSGPPGQDDPTPHEDVAKGHQLVRLVASGLNLHQASQRLAMPWKSAQHAFTRTLAEIADDRTKHQILQTELETLGMLQSAQMRKALNGDSEAARTVLRIMERRSKYLGLDEAIKVQIQTAEVNEAVREITTILEGEVENVAPLRRELPRGA